MFRIGGNDRPENNSTQAEPPLLHEKSNLDLVKQQNKKQKTGIWYMLFGEKKCKHCSDKKQECNCKAKKKTKNKVTQSDFDMKTRCDKNRVMGNSATFSTSKEPEIFENMANCILPEDRRGCGCHLYFCIDKPQQNTSHSKHKRMKQQKNEDIKMKISPKCCSKNSNVSDSFESELPKITIVCDPSDEIVPDEETKKEKQSRNESITINSGNSAQGKKISFPAIPHSEIIAQVQNLDPYLQKQAFEDHKKLLSNKIQSRESKEKNVVNEEFKPNYEICYENEKSEMIANDPENFESIVQSVTVKPAVVPNDENSGDRNMSVTDPEDEAILREYEAYKKCSRIRKSPMKFLSNKIQSTESTEKNVVNEEFKPNCEIFYENEKSEMIANDPKNFESIVQSVTVKPAVVPNDENSDGRKVRVTDPDEEAILREYEAYKKSSRIRKSTTRTARTSVMTFRRQRQSQLDKMNVSVILRKLNSIEEKLTELENKNETDNIMMGISCNKRQSRVAIKFNKHSDKDKLKDQTPRRKHSFKGKDSQKIVEVKSQKEYVIINSPGQVKIVNEKKSPENVKNIVSIPHNSLEIDAHTLGCNSRMVKCTNPKILIECPKRSLENKTCDQWRRISEELKISKPNVACCAKCSCKTCCCKK